MPTKADPSVMTIEDVWKQKHPLFYALQDYFDRHEKLMDRTIRRRDLMEEEVMLMRDCSGGIYPTTMINQAMNDLERIRGVLSNMRGHRDALERMLRKHDPITGGGK